MEESIFDFKYVRLYDVDIPKEKWLNYLQIVETRIRCHILQSDLGLHSALFASYQFRGLQSSMIKTVLPPFRKYRQ